MIDLHSHLLPGIDDGAKDLDTALAMARCAVADGIQTMACTPHIYPGLYENDSAGIHAGVVALQAALDEAGIALRLVAGADTHLAPDLPAAIRAGRVPTLGGSRYLLLEPPHHVAPPRLEQTLFALMTAGYVPVITHPERLTWIEDHYELMTQLSAHGALMQITAGSLTGRFGRRPRYWAERMLDEGKVDLLATDAHNLQRRAPLLAEARQAAVDRVGETEAWHLVRTRPQGILADLAPHSLPPRPAPPPPPERGSLLRRLFTATTSP